MTLTQYRKLIRQLSRDELEAHLFQLFKTSKLFKDIESSSWSCETCDALGYGVADDMETMLEDVREVLGYYDFLQSSKMPLDVPGYKEI